MKQLILFLFLFSILISAQQDSVKTYNLESITVKADKELKAKVINKIEYRNIEKSDAVTVSDLGKLIPAVKTQNNSRGETLFFIRGAGERQVTLFFDGVPLNTPWDNRIDLSLVPAEAIGEINITKGIASVIYGANAVSGVININSKAFSGKRFGKILVHAGENNEQRYSALYLNGNEDLSYLLTSSFRKTDGFNLPGSYDNVSANPSGVRLNSQSRSFDLFGKVNYQVKENINLGLSASFINSEKGVPPETDVANPRFWKYPVWEKTSVSLNGSYKFPNTINSKIDFSFAAVGFKSQIDQFADQHFRDITDVEKNNDLTVYANAQYSGVIGASGILKAAVNGFSTLHKEQIKSDNYIEQTYAQNIISVGIEYEQFIDKLTVIGGVGFDHSDTPETGDKQSSDALKDFSFNTGMVYSFNNLQSLHFSLGRKTRFPTLREAYSGALGRFIPNPGLKAEVAYSGEAGFSNLFNSGKADVTFFLTYLRDGIIRESLPGGKFQRTNKDAIKTMGIETSANFNFTDQLSAYFHFTYLTASARNDEGKYSDTLEYKPEVISTINFLYDFKNGFETLLELNYTGKEFGLKEGSEYFMKLPGYLLMNFRLSYRFFVSDAVKIEIFGRVNNIFDKLYYSQWSLPEAGRSFLFGMSGEF